jgi:hypothetical protein
MAETLGEFKKEINEAVLRALPQTMEKLEPVLNRHIETD